MKIKFLSTVIFSLLLSFILAQDSGFEHSMWQWVTGSNISDKRLNEVAPHFPKPASVDFDMVRYDQEIQRWQVLYCFEYEAFVNAPELSALNPYYTGYEDVIQMPYFIRPLSSFEKPEMKSTGNSFEDELDHELDIQAWYFVFHPDQFYQIYKVKPTFPDWFDVTAYRAQIIKKIEETEKQIALKNTEKN